MDPLTFVLIVFGLGCGIGALATLDITAWSRRTREAALRAELEALRAAQALSIEAWQARQAMAAVAREYDMDGELDDDVFDVSGEW